MSSPLHGTTILAVEQYGAGPFGTQHLADLGAEVIKIEDRQSGGDYARGLGPYFVGGDLADDKQSDASLYFQSLNRNKKSLTLDLKQPEGKAILHKIVQQVDAVANNLRGDVPEKLGLTYDQLKSYNPSIVCAHCNGYGREGERSTWPGYDFLMQAETGFFHMSGEPETPPTRMGLSVVDFLGGTYMALGILAGIIGARESGQGRDIDISLFDTALSLFSYMGAWALNADYDPQRVERSAHAALVPCQYFHTADGWIYIMCNKAKFWPLLCEALDRKDLIEDPRFVDFEQRLKNRTELTSILDACFKQHTTDEWLADFAGNIPAAPIRTPGEFFSDPKLEIAGKIQNFTLAGGEPFKLVRSPFVTQIDQPPKASPTLGANTEEILKRIGLGAQDIADLVKKGVI